MTEELRILISAQVNNLKQGVQQAKKEVKSFKERVADAKKQVGADFKNMGETIKATVKAIGVSIAGLGVALLGIAASTEEYRNQQAQLQTAFQTAGASAEAATATYNGLYRVLGDGGQAQEAAQHLAKLTNNSEHLAEWTNICQGVYATFGNSLPIEGLTEAVNHTTKLGEVQGSLADALEWAGISVDDFNAQLAECSTEAEREALIRETLNGLYDEAAENYEETNAAILAQRDAQAKLDAALGSIGAAVAPVITAFTSLAADALAIVAPYITDLAEQAIPKLKELLDGIIPALQQAAEWVKEHTTLLGIIAAIIGTVVAAITLYNAAAAIKAAMDAAEVTTVSGLISAHLAHAAAVMSAVLPYILIIAAIALLVAGFLYLWNNCEGFRQFWLDMWEKLKVAFAAFVESLKPIWEAIVRAFQEAWELIKVVWDIVQPYFAALWEKIKEIFAVVVEVLGGFFSAAWEAIKIIWDSVVAYFTAIWDSIAAIFSVVKDVLNGNFESAWEGIKGIFATWGAFFTGLWDDVKAAFAVVSTWFSDTFSGAWESVKSAFSTVSTFFTGIWESIKSIFADVGSAIATAVSGTVSTAINSILSTGASIINGFINAINGAISIINAIPGVNIGYLSTLSVPAMAKGGIVDSATLAVVGEQGKEAVVPLENNLEWLDKLAGMLNDRMGGNQPIAINVDGKRFGEIAVDTINGLTRQRGSIPLVIA